MKSNPLKPLGYYQSDRRDEIMNTIALEFGDRLELLSTAQKREALVVLAIANLTGSINLGADTVAYSISPLTLPRNFCFLAMELTRDGWLALSISLAQSLRETR